MLGHDIPRVFHVEPCGARRTEHQAEFRSARARSSKVDDRHNQPAQRNQPHLSQNDGSGSIFIASLFPIIFFVGMLGIAPSTSTEHAPAAAAHVIASSTLLPSP